MVMLGRFNQKIPRGIHPVKAEWPPGRAMALVVGE
jgi:hypothetical protein